MDCFSNKCTSQWKLFRGLAIFNFESTCFWKDAFKDTQTTMWIWKLLPMCNLNSSNILTEPTFLRNSDPHHRVEFHLSSWNLSSPRQRKIEIFVLCYWDNKCYKLGTFWEKLTKRRNRWEQMRIHDKCQFDCENEFLTDTKKSKTWTSGTSGSLLWSLTCVCSQQRKKFENVQNFAATHSS